MQTLGTKTPYALGLLTTRLHPSGPGLLGLGPCQAGVPHFRGSWCFPGLRESLSPTPPGDSSCDIQGSLAQGDAVGPLEAMLTDISAMVRSASTAVLATQICCNDSNSQRLLEGCRNRPERVPALSLWGLPICPMGQGGCGQAEPWLPVPTVPSPLTAAWRQDELAVGWPIPAQFSSLSRDPPQPGWPGVGNAPLPCCPSF